jgi:hypothetical protein
MTLIFLSDLASWLTVERKDFRFVDCISLLLHLSTLPLPGLDWTGLDWTGLDWTVMI